MHMDLQHEGLTPWPDDDSHAEEEPSEQTPAFTHPWNNDSCLGWYYLTYVYQSICTSI
jgi:hypothetical protein